MNDALAQIVRGPLLVPRADGTVDFFADGALASDAAGVVQYAGDWLGIASSVAARSVRTASGVMIPPLVDIHLHIPQHPIRGHFVDGVPDDAPGGKLLAGLELNVFPAEARCHDPAHAKAAIDAFARDVLSHGVVGGCAYMMVSARATAVALQTLPETWSVGMVLMNQNCPEYLTTHEPSVERDIGALADAFGARCVVTDRFAVAVDSRLRGRASKLAAKHGLRTQTHLNEQVGEKDFVERVLYPDAKSYTHVYLDDGLLDHRCVLAHCIQMRDDEWRIVRDTNSVVAHCPTSNLLLGSGTMPLDAVIDRGIPYAIATDVGASPTVSMLAEMGRFLSVHSGKSSRATPAEALYRATRAPAEILGIDVGALEVGRPMSFLEIAADVSKSTSADDAIRALVPADLDSPKAAVERVTLAGRVAYERADERSMVDA